MSNFSPKNNIITTFEPPHYLINEFVVEYHLEQIEASSGVKLKYDKEFMNIFSKPQITIISDDLSKNNDAYCLLSKRASLLKHENPILMEKIDQYWKNCIINTNNNELNTFLMIDGPYLFTSIATIYAKIEKEVILDIPNFTRKIESLAPCSQVNFYSKNIVGAIRSGKYEREQCFPYKQFKDNGYSTWVTKLIPAVGSDNSLKVFNDDVFAIGQLQQFQNILLRQKINNIQNESCVMIMTGDGNINHSYDATGLSFITTINQFLQNDLCKVILLGFTNNLNKQYHYFLNEYPNNFRVIFLDDLVKPFLKFKDIRKSYSDTYKLKISAINPEVEYEHLRAIFKNPDVKINLRPVVLKTGNKWCIISTNNKNERDILYKEMDNSIHTINQLNIHIKFDPLLN